MTGSGWLPNFFIAGVPKAGTSSLHTWLSDHPDALGSREKETYFFVDPDTHMFNPKVHFMAGYAAYEGQFRQAVDRPYKVIMESTPSYVYSQTALHQIPGLPTQPKCLFVVREPASQLLSLYSYFKNNWNWIPSGMSFGDFLTASRQGTHNFNGNELAQNAVQNACYVDYLRGWKDALGPDRMKVVTFDALKSDPCALTCHIAEWLGLDPAFYETYDFGRENETYEPRNRLLQRVNIAVRSALPKGRGYEKLRTLYRKLNTTAGSKNTADDIATMTALRAEFAAKNAELSDEFHLDLNVWN